MCSTQIHPNLTLIYVAVIQYYCPLTFSSITIFTFLLVHAIIGFDDAVARGKTRHPVF